MGQHTFVHGCDLNIEAMWEALSESEALRLIPVLLRRWSGLYAYDRAIDAAEIAEDIGLDEPWA